MPQCIEKPWQERTSLRHSAPLLCQTSLFPIAYYQSLYAECLYTLRDFTMLSYPEHGELCLSQSAFFHGIPFLHSMLWGCTRPEVQRQPEVNSLYSSIANCSFCHRGAYFPVVFWQNYRRSHTGSFIAMSRLIRNRDSDMKGHYGTSAVYAGAGTPEF